MKVGRLIIWFGVVVLSLTGCGRNETAYQKKALQRSSTRSTALAQSSGASCLKSVRGRDIGEDVKNDIAAGETRFFIYSGQEPPMSVAPGIKQCAYSFWKSKRPNNVAGFQLTNDLMDPICIAALGNYVADYNRMMAAQNPDSIRMNCLGGKGRVDPSYPKTDIDAYQRRNYRSE